MQINGGKSSSRIVLRYVTQVLTPKFRLVGSSINTVRICSEFDQDINVRSGNSRRRSAHGPIHLRSKEPVGEGSPTRSRRGSQVVTRDGIYSSLQMRSVKTT